MSKQLPSNKEEWVATKEENPPLQTAVVFEGEASEKCGCSLRLEPLMEYLESQSSAKCPVCQSPIEVVCDGMAHSKSDEEAAPVVAFKYRKHLYRLSVTRDPKVDLRFPYSMGLWMWFSLLNFTGEDTTFTAQERIAQVLRMDLNSGMRILHKGKILYPNTQQSSQIISEQLLNVCEKGGKPLVMGTRMTEREQKIATLKWCYNLFYRIVGAFIAKAIGTVRGIISPFLGGAGGGGPAIDGRPHRD